MKDKILINTYSQISYHKQPQDNEFETLCRLIYKSIYGENPKDLDQSVSASGLLEINEGLIQSVEKQRSVGELYLLKESMPKKHYVIKDNLNNPENPIVVVNYQGRERLIDGANRINYWFAKGDLKKLLKVNLHVVSPVTK